jgi:hypothetical protein
VSLHAAPAERRRPTGNRHRARGAETRRLGLVAALVGVAAILAFVLYAITDGSGLHSWNSGAVPGQSFQLTEGKTYQLSTKGGVSALQARGASTTAPTCTWTSGGDAARALTVTLLPDDSRALNQIGTFVGPASGEIAIDCVGWDGAYVDDADNSTFDVSGLFLLLGIALTLAAVLLGLTSLYRWQGSRPKPAAMAPTDGGYSRVT